MGSIRTRAESNALFFDFRYRGIRCKELTKLKPNKANIFRLKAIMKSIQKEIDEETFSYRKYFPNSKRADLFESMTPGITSATNEELLAGAQVAALEMRNTGAKKQSSILMACLVSLNFLIFGLLNVKLVGSAPLRGK